VGRTPHGMATQIIKLDTLPPYPKNEAAPPESYSTMITMCGFDSNLRQFVSLSCYTHTTSNRGNKPFIR